MKIKDRVKPKTPSVPAGTYPAVCVGVIDIGEQYSELYKSYSNRLIFVWALPTKLDAAGEEIQLSREFSITTKKGSKFRDFIESWNGQAYTDDDFCEIDPAMEIGKKNLLSVTINDTGEYANVSGIMAFPDGFPAVESKTAPFTWDMDSWDDAAFEKLPEWAQEKIKKSTQYQKAYAPQKTVEIKEEPATGQKSEGAPF